MAHLLRLSAFALLCAGLFPASALASCIIVGTSGYCSDQGTATAQAQAACDPGTSGTYTASFQLSSPLVFVIGPNEAEYQGKAQPVRRRISDGATAGCSAIKSGYASNYYWLNAPPPNECDERNDDPAQKPGTRLSLAQNSGPKCVAGCTLDVVGDPIETVPGRVQGQPVVYYRWNQSYTGETCTSDAEPGDNAQDLEPTETPEGDKQCNPSLGVCVNENGENEYCTFNPDNTPSSCVPAVDYDNDGVNDDDDTQPGDPTNGSDEGDGNETDNSASGGAKCPHDGGGPPACKGDAIQCNLLLQQYLARCSAEKVASGKLGGGIACSMSEALTCTNLSPSECWAKAMQKKAGCAAEGIGEAITGELAEGEEGTEVDPASAWVTPAEGEGDIDLDMGGWLGSRTCPTIPSFSVMGKTISFESVRGDMCNFFAVGGMLVLLLAAYQCARILGET